MQVWWCGRSMTTLLQWRLHDAGKLGAGNGDGGTHRAATAAALLREGEEEAMKMKCEHGDGAAQTGGDAWPHRLHAAASFCGRWATEGQADSDINAPNRA